MILILIFMQFLSQSIDRCFFVFQKIFLSYPLSRYALKLKFVKNSIKSAIWIELRKFMCNSFKYSWKGILIFAKFHPIFFIVHSLQCGMSSILYYEDTMIKIFPTVKKQKLYYGVCGKAKIFDNWHDAQPLMKIYSGIRILYG